MATSGTLITRENFSTTPYSYHPSGSDFAADTWYWFYKSNVCWDVYILNGGYGTVSIRLDFWDYNLNTWIPFTSDIGTVGDYGYQYRLYANSSENTFRFFHNCLRNYDNSAYTATTKVKDNLSLTNGSYTYDTRGYSLWRIGFNFSRYHTGHDFHINSFGPGYLYDTEYTTVCYGKKIYCGGKGDPNSDDQYIESGTGTPSQYFRLYFDPFYFMGDEISASLDRQCIPDWTSFRT